MHLTLVCPMMIPVYNIVTHGIQGVCPMFFSWDMVGSCLWIQLVFMSTFCCSRVFCYCKYDCTWPIWTSNIHTIMQTNTLAMPIIMLLHLQNPSQSQVATNAFFHTFFEGLEQHPSTRQCLRVKMFVCLYCRNPLSNPYCKNLASNSPRAT